MSVNKETKHAVLAAAGFCCHYCSDHATTVDHKVPQRDGGSDEKSNLLAACKPCNMAKGTLPYDLFCRFMSRFGRPPADWSRHTNRYVDGAVSKILTNVELDRAFEIVLEKFGNMDPTQAANKIRRASTAHKIQIDAERLEALYQERLVYENIYKL